LIITTQSPNTNSFHTCTAIAMAFFRPHVYSAPYTQHQPEAEPSFHGLFRLLEDWDNHHNASSTPATKDSNTSEASRPRKRQHLLSRSQQPEHKEEPIFTPRFDVKETESAYELYGDLPGVAKDVVNIEFRDPQTLVVSGHVERDSFSLEKNNRPTGSEDEDAVMISHHENEHDEHSETASQRSLQATVEDDTEDSPAGTAAKDNTSKTVATITKPKTTTQPQAQQPKSKYWISERPHGSFSRTFAFPERLDLDGVKASLENGVLALVVPKARKYEAKRISVL